VGFFLPAFWLRRRVRQRKHEIDRALPDALDMLTIGVEAGLAFESALLRVAEQWQNALTEEFRRAVREMQLGSAREEALRRMADRTGVESLGTFVAVLVQSTRLGVSIAQVLHTQAAQMRLKRRQLAEERARQASVKMVFPLVFLIFPAIFIIVLGPSVPEFLRVFGGPTPAVVP
jgi:tight adherence protein C